MRSIPHRLVLQCEMGSIIIRFQIGFQFPCVCVQSDSCPIGYTIGYSITTLYIRSLLYLIRSMCNRIRPENIIWSLMCAIGFHSIANFEKTFCDFHNLEEFRSVMLSDYNIIIMAVFRYTLPILKIYHLCHVYYKFLILIVYRNTSTNIFIERINKDILSSYNSNPNYRLSIRSRSKLQSNNLNISQLVDMHINIRFVLLLYI